ncbi:MAG: Ton complex subunit ExbD [Sodalis sp. Fse]|nr:MAG: Ton complex subunit ExbD [Sodalis sp. Fse]
MAMHLNENIDDTGEIHDINVTSLIDIMLVLVVIFMAAAPLATVDIRVDLPNSTSAPQARSKKPLFLSIKANKQLYIGEQRVDMTTLVQTLDKQTQGNKETTIFFQADKSVDYVTLISVMDNLRLAGYFKIGLMGLPR